MMTSAAVPAEGSRLPTVIRGAGKPRLPLKLASLGAIWSLFTWLVYPYAVDLALWEGAERYAGLGLMAVVAVTTFRALQTWARFAWHLGLLGLLVLGLSAGVGISIERGLTADATTTRDWLDAARSVVSDARREAAQIWDWGVNLPAEVYASATARRPFWQADPSRMVTSPTLDEPAPPGQGNLPAVLGGLHVGSLARVLAAEDGVIAVADRPSGPQVAEILDQMVVVVLDGPIEASDRIWWLVDDGRVRGWGTADQLESFGT